jgi:hypothetical protein
MATKKISLDDVEIYVESIPKERKSAFDKLRSAIKGNLPKGFTEVMNYGMLSYVVPHELYPKGYHCKPELPLPFISIASQKNFIAVYHMGIYADTQLLQWFQDKYKKASSAKLDMGKSCIRFKNLDEIPFKLIGELSKKINVKKWIDIYESQFLKSGKK